jgi:hypothetical protein
MFALIIISIIIGLILLMLAVRKGLEDGFGLGARKDAHDHYKWIMREQPRQRRIREVSRSRRYEEDSEIVRGSWKKPINHAADRAMRADARTSRSLRRGKDPTKHARDHLFYSGMLRSLLGGRDQEMNHIREKHFGTSGSRHIARVTHDGKIKPGISRGDHPVRGLKNLIIGSDDKK